MERISFGRLFSNSQTNISRNFARVFEAQSQLATGKRINRPSDDIVGTRRLLTLVGERGAIDRYLGNVATSRSSVQTGSSQLQEMSGTLARIRELAIQGANGTITPNDRDAIAAEIDQLLQNAISTANTKFEGRFLFSGTKTRDLPFELITGGDGLQRLQYNGNGDLQEIDVAPDLRLPINVPGSDLLATGTRGATTFAGSTGAAPGAGNDTGMGRDILQINHTQTLFGSPSGPGGADPATGLMPSASSAANDTVLGSAHTILVSTDAVGNGTISLNGGPSVAFTPTDTDLQVAGPNGELIHIDASAMLPNLPAGTVVPLQSDGTMSTDGGATTVPIAFGSAAQQVVDSETGSVLHVDTTQISSVGTEGVTFPGTSDLFTSIIAIRDILQDSSRQPSDINTAINVALDDFDEGHNRLTRAISVMGSRSGQLESVEGRLGDLGVTLDALSGEIEDADISKVVSDLSRYEALYQASLVLTTRVNSLSLLNFI